MPSIIETLRSMEGRAMKAEQVANLLQVEISTIYRKVRNGSIPGFGFDGSVRIDPAELADHLERKTRLGVKKQLKPTVQ